MKYKTVLILSFSLIALQPAQAITWQLSKNINIESTTTIDSNIHKFTALGGISCEVEKPFINPFKKKQWLRVIKCVKNGMEASATVGCEKGEEDGVHFTFNELKGSGYVSPFLGCK